GRPCNRIFDGKKLAQVRGDGAAKSLIIRGAGFREFRLPHTESAGGGKGGSFQLVGCLIFSVVALDGKCQRGVSSVFSGQIELEFVEVFRLGSELQWFGIVVAILVIIPKIGKVELAER